MRWVSAAITLVVLGWLVWSFAASEIEWSVVASFLTAPIILKGLLNTIMISVAAMAIGLVIGVLTAAMRLSANPVASSVSWLYVWIFRGTPLFLQLLIWFNLAIVFRTMSVPGLFEVDTVTVMTPLVAALLGLGLNEGAYCSENIRGGILSVDPGQTEAATAAGFTKLQTLRMVVLPQALPAIVPPLGNEMISMLKMSSLAAAISFGELLSASQTIYFSNSRVIELLFVAAFWYMLVTSISSVLQYLLERRLGRSRSNSQERDLLQAVLNAGLKVRRA